MEKKQKYQKPELEILEFEIEESVAASVATNSFWGTLGAEDIWGDE